MKRYILSCHSLDMRVSLFHSISFFAITKSYLLDSIVNLFKISLTQVTNPVRFFGRGAILINKLFPMLATIPTDELDAAFTLVDAGEFPVWIRGWGTWGWIMCGTVSIVRLSSLCWLVCWGTLIANEEKLGDWLGEILYIGELVISVRFDIGARL